MSHQTIEDIVLFHRSFTRFSPREVNLGRVTVSVDDWEKIKERKLQNEQELQVFVDLIKSIGRRIQLGADDPDILVLNAP